MTLKLQILPLFLLGGMFASCFQSEEADLILHNARIYVMDTSGTTAEAMAIKDGKVVEFGPERQILNKYSGERYDAGKMVVYPGFIDAHSHFVGYALSLGNVNLVGTRSWDEVIQKTAEFFPKDHQGWIQGRGWDQNDWEIKLFPDKSLLDSLYPDKPVLLNRIDGHAGIANQKALDLIGITPETKIEGGEIGLVNGQLTGLLIDNALELAKAAVQEPSTSRKIALLAQAERNCLAKGLTSVCDAGLDYQDINLIDSLQESGTLKIKVYAMATDSKENFAYFEDKEPIKKDRLTVTSFKFYMDGALGSRGACLLEPYSDVDPEFYGMLLNTTDYFQEKWEWCYNKGFQVCTHAIGDSAIRMTLDGYANFLEENNDRRWRIEHSQIVHPDDLNRFRELVVIPSVQPTHGTSDMYWAEDRIGEERIKYAYAWKDLADQLHFIPLGTDFPVEDIDPLKTFYSAVYRKDEFGYPEGGFQIQNALTADQALRGMTIWAAIANFEEESKGSLELGKKADFVVMNRDLFKVDESEVLDTKCLATFVNGELVYQQQ